VAARASAAPCPKPGYAALVTAAHTQLAAPVILIWDNLNTHISAHMRAWIDARADWLTVEHLPACAPELNAVEGAWAHMKNSLGNLAVPDVSQLAAIVKNRLKSIQYRPALIESFLAQTRLTLEPEPPQIPDPDLSTSVAASHSRRVLVRPAGSWRTSGKPPERDVP
jgi:transposase